MEYDELMGFNEYRESASLLRLLGNHKRLEIVVLLHGHELTVNQIAQMTALRQATVSQHLIALKASNLVTSNTIGKEVYYSLSSNSLIPLSLLMDRLTSSKPTLDSEPTVIDPVCHMQLTPDTAHSTVDYGGVRHYFCGVGCRRTFIKEHK